jgi:hypothetical protein
MFLQGFEMRVAAGVMAGIRRFAVPAAALLLQMALPDALAAQTPSAAKS